MENQVKIMVVDDEIGICQNVEKILTKNDYAVVHTQSAAQALEMMKDGSFSLLISDIVMPEMNGLELLNHVAKEVPDIKTVMMTGYASTNTAVKAIRLGALDYIPKPFTPDELRTTVSNALLGKLEEIKISDEERNTIEIMDVDIDFGGEAAPNLVKPDETPVQEEADETAEFYCSVGKMSCDVLEKLGATCKTGIKKNFCPKLKARAKKLAKAGAPKKAFNPKKMIGIDQPFDYDEVMAVTGPEYVRDMDRDGFAFMPYEELKKLDPEKKAAEFKAAARESSSDILVVDDEIAVNNNIRKILGKSGLEVDQAVSRDEALEKINAQPYKLVLLDLRMPGVSGLELLEAVAKRQPQARVIIITGYASIETAIETARIGAVDYLPKPFTPDELRQVTQRAYTLAA